MTEEPGVVHNLQAQEFPLRPTGILDGRGRMIYSKASMGYTRPLREFVVQEEEKRP